MGRSIGVPLSSSPSRATVASMSSTANPKCVAPMSALPGDHRRLLDAAEMDELEDRVRVRNPEEHGVELQTRGPAHESRDERGVLAAPLRAVDGVAEQLRVERDRAVEIARDDADMVDPEHQSSSWLAGTPSRRAGLSTSIALVSAR